MNAETVDEMLEKLDSSDGYLRALSRKQSNERWLTSIEDGYKWLIPAEGRQNMMGSQETRTLLCNYDALEIAEGDDVPDAVRKMADGLRAFTDGGTERRDPTEDPRACSRCGVHIGFLGDDYCDPCAREIGARGDIVRCMGCGQDGPEEQMESVDISSEDEYYPTIRYLCPSCSGGEP